MPRQPKIRSLKDILVLAQRIAGSKSAGNNRLALASADQEEGLKCVDTARKHGLIKPILIGDRQAVTRRCRSLKISLTGVEIVDEPDPKLAAVKAVAMCRDGSADILMKGAVDTSVILRAVLDRDHGLGRGGLLSNVTLFDSPIEKRLMFMSDPAVVIKPDVVQKVDMVRNAIWVAHRLGFARPKVAVLAAVEKVNPKAMPDTADAAVLNQMGASGQFANADIAGPYALDIAVSKKAAETKHVTGPVAGSADILMCPDIQSANIFYKSLVYFAGREIANAIVGVKTPLVMSSRSDSSLTKLYTMALSVVLAGGEQ
ncbi:MAG: phosphate acyltransferase [Thermoguttaceae bacterium]